MRCSASSKVAQPAFVQSTCNIDTWRRIKRQNNKTTNHPKAHVPHDKRYERDEMHKCALAPQHGGAQHDGA
jgi:hypothetical protein